MKTRESGMPPDEMWKGYFAPQDILKKLALTESCRDPEECRLWAVQVGFMLAPPGFVDLPPYHYGLLFQRPR